MAFDDRNLYVAIPFFLLFLVLAHQLDKDKEETQIDTPLFQTEEGRYLAASKYLHTFI